MTENLRIEYAREEDGRWIAEAIHLPGVMVYGRSREEAHEKVENLAIEVLQEQNILKANAPE